MASCKECIHYCVCKAVADTGKFVLDTERPDQSERCPNFADKSRFIELPCKIGDTVWVIVNGIKKPLEAQVRSVDIKNTIDINTAVKGYYSVTVNSGDFGKSLFLTKEEAEEALTKKMKEGGET